MTQPQDKMRAEFEAAMRAEPYRWSRIDFDRETDFHGQSYAWVRTQAAWGAWQAACAQQCAQSHQDALDAARYRALRDESLQLLEGDPCFSDDCFNTYFGEDLDACADMFIKRKAVVFPSFAQGASNV